MSILYARSFLKIAAALMLCSVASFSQDDATGSPQDQAQPQKFARANGNAASLPSTGTSATASSIASNASRGGQKDIASSYRIGEQDLLAITVWREPELSGTVMVRPDGKITLPLLNDVNASGLTPDELKNTLTEKLRPFVNVPQVTVAVREINSRKVYIIGQVGREGSYRINSTTTVLQIIAEAGGLREFANRKGIYVLRNDNGNQTRLSFNYENVIRGKDTHQNILVRPGDTIVVP